MKRHKSAKPLLDSLIKFQQKTSLLSLRRRKRVIKTKRFKTNVQFTNFLFMLLNVENIYSQHTFLKIFRY